MLHSGDLHVLYPGVYAVGRPDVSDYGRCWAAILATRGDGPVPHRRALGHRSAAAAEGIRPFPVQPEIVVADAILKVPGIVIRRTGSLLDEDIRMDRRRLPWTTWKRTLTDLPAISTAEQIRDDLDACERLELLDVAALEAVMRRRRGKKGLAKLNTALDLYRELSDAEFLSLLERLATRLLKTPGIPEPEVNGRVVLLGGQSIRVDLLLRGVKVALEVDGRAHLRKKQRRVDYWRDRELVKLGYVVLRFGWHDVLHHPGRVIADLLAVLATRGA